MKRTISFCVFYFVLGICSLKSQTAEPDSVVLIVLNALTTEESHVSKPINELLTNCSWEALAYWDMETPKVVGSLNEAVGDRYQFNLDNTFEIRLIDPQDGNQAGLTIKGTFLISENNLILTSQNGKEMIWNIHLLDKNYLILETDGLRIFYTKGKSYFSYD